MRYQITSYFNQQEGFRTKLHNGIDFAMPNGTPIKSITNGIIEKVVNLGDKNIGKGILIKCKDGKTAIYGHLSKITVSEGDKIRIGDLIGYSGNSGYVAGINGGYHLHFGLKENGIFIDPSPYINAIQSMNIDNNQYALTINDLIQSQLNYLSTLNDYFHLKISLINYSILIQYFQNLF